MLSIGTLVYRMVLFPSGWVALRTVEKQSKMTSKQTDESIDFQRVSEYDQEIPQSHTAACW